ncbi:MAG: hypothetical protein V4717_02605 [Bacteroidota bacterium]
MESSADILAYLVKPDDELVLQSRDFIEALECAINELITHDFNRLVQILYQLDVPEEKLRNIFSSATGLDAGTIIASLLVERQIQRLRSKKSNQTKPSDIPDEERW